MFHIIINYYTSWIIIIITFDIPTDLASYQYSLSVIFDCHEMFIFDNVDINFDYEKIPMLSQEIADFENDFFSTKIKDE